MIDRGYMIVAQNSATVDYISCAIALAKSIKRVEPSASVTLLSDVQVQESVFDYTLLFPHGDRCITDSWKLANDWQVYDASPYKQTIKLEADMYLPRSIEHWWDTLQTRDLHICTTIRNFRGQISKERYYRQTIDKNNLPDTYNAITYWSKSTLAQEFYSVVRDIFENWEQYSNTLVLARSEGATTDIVYALAAKIIGENNCTLPSWDHISMVHMKKIICDTRQDDWTKELVTELHPPLLRINTFPQMYPFHYHLKHFASTLRSAL